MALWFSSLVLAMAAAACPQQDGKAPVKLPPQEDVDAMRPGFDPLHPVPQRPLSPAPLRISSNNLFQSLFGYLPVESADTLDDGRFEVGLEMQTSSGKLNVSTPDYFFHYDATLVETALAARMGLYGDWDVGLRLELSNLLENKGDIILIRQGKALVKQGTRSTALSDVDLWTKKRLLSTGEEGALSIVVGTKIPVSRSHEDLLTSGGVDFAASLVWTEALAPFTFHVNVGALVPGKVQVFEEEVDTRNALTFGAAVAYTFAEWGTVLAQVQGNQSVFKDSTTSIAILHKTVATAHFGGRFRIGSYFLEASVGFGLTDQSSDLVILASLSLPL